MDKTLIEIERNYVSDIVNFFSREYSFLLKKSRSSAEITTLMSKQIENRLLDPGVILDFKVEVTLLPNDERRDRVIGNLIDDNNENIVNRVKVFIYNV